MDLRGRLARYWVYFTRGHRTYLVFPLSLANFLVLQHRLLLPYLAPLGLLPSLTVFAATFLAAYAPLAVLVGWLDYKKFAVPARGALGALTNPYWRDVTRALVEMCEGERELARERLRKWAEPETGGPGTRMGLLMRLWTYFRQGHSAYFALAISFANTIAIQYPLLVEKISFLRVAFASLWVFAASLLTVYLPAAVIVGWLDYRKFAMPVELEVTARANPFLRDLARALMLMCDGKYDEAKRVLEKWVSS